MKKIIYSILKIILILLLIVLWPIGRIEAGLRQLLAKKKSTLEAMQKLDYKLLGVGYEEEERPLYTMLLPRWGLKSLGFIK